MLRDWRGGRPSILPVLVYQVQGPRVGGYVDLGRLLM